MTTDKQSKKPKTKTVAADQHDHSGHDHSHDGHDHAGHSHDHSDQLASGQAQLPIAPNSQITVTLPWATVEPAYQKTLRRFARDLKIDGFRKGKVPPSMVEDYVNQSSLIEHVLQIALPDAYTQAIKDADKHPITQPEIDPVKMDKGSDWEVVVYFAEAPVITLGKYQASVKTALKDAETEITEREAEMAKQAKEKAKEEKKADTEEKTEDTPVQTNLTDEQKDETRTRYVFKKLVEDINPQVPELLVRREADRELRRLLEQLEQLKLSAENYLKSRGITPDQLRLEYLAAAAASLQLEFILAEIGKEEKILVENAEVDEQLAKVFGKKMTDEQKNNSEYRSYVFSSIVKQKIVKHLLSLS